MIGKSFCASLIAALLTASQAMAATDPSTELNQLDKRVPVPLLPHMAVHQKQNMREHLESVQGIIDGLQKKDFKAIEASASKMGFTPEMGQMCQRMGAGAEGFSEKAITFHKTADQIAVFARKKDQKGVLNTLHQTLAQCTSCHSTYRQQVVDEATYNALVGKMKSR
jgi:cytochrome c556